MHYRVGLEIVGYVELVVEATDSLEAASFAKDAVLNRGLPEGVQIEEVQATHIQDHPVVTFARDGQRG